MLTVTDNATSYLKGLIDQADLEDGAVLRLVVGQEGLGLTPDTEKDADTAYQAPDGDTVLVVEGALAEKLDSVTLDVQQTEQGPRLAIG